MSEKFEILKSQHMEFINNQHMFFVATSGKEGFINLSPKGMDTLRVINENRVLWLNLTGSGNETAAHVTEDGRMTIMFCSFDRKPLILRLYGSAEVFHPRSERWSELKSHFPSYPGVRQIFELNVSLVLTSCGFSVPLYHFVGDRPTLLKWIKYIDVAKGIEQYWEEENTKSLDKNDTYILNEP